MATFNSNNYDEILSKNISKENDFNINDSELKILKEKIDYYFSIYSPNNKIFNEFIKYITIYLKFIVEKPFHPVGMRFSNGNYVFKKKDKYYCTGKSKFIKETNSLCKDCVCSDI